MCVTLVAATNDFGRAKEKEEKQKLEDESSARLSSILMKPTCRLVLLNPLFTFKTRMDHSLARQPQSSVHIRYPSQLRPERASALLQRHLQRSPSLSTFLPFFADRSNPSLHLSLLINPKERVTGGAAMEKFQWQRDKREKNAL